MCEEIAKGINTEEREYHFKGIKNFRDLGGYRAKDRKIIAWNRLYRSGELQFMTSRDFSRLKHEVRPISVIDLRNESQGEGGGIGRLSELGVRYFHIPVTLYPRDDYKSAGELFASLAGQEEFGRKAADVIKILADIENLPLIIHCNAGRIRTGCMAAIILDILGVSDEDIENDYRMSAPESDSILFFLKPLRDKCGSVRDYVKAQGVDESLFTRLEKALLTNPPGPSALSE